MPPSARAGRSRTTGSIGTSNAHSKAPRRAACLREAFATVSVCSRKAPRGARRDEFGKGSRGGVAAPETANNASAGGAYVPLLTLAIPEPILAPLILFFCLIGVYLVSFNAFDLWLMVGLAVICLVLRLLDYPMAPLLLGFVLGKLMQESLRRALLVHNGSFEFLWQRPVTAGLLAISVACIAAPPLWRWRRNRCTGTGSSTAGG
jgi:TctA family transporter